MKRRNVPNGQISSFEDKFWVKDELFEIERNVLPATGDSINANIHYIQWEDFLSTHKSPFAEYGEEFERQFRIVTDGSFSKSLFLDGLLIRRKSVKLLVVFHGALDRQKYSLPRFEFKSTLQDFDGSVLFMSDPTLQTHDDLGLAWYIWDENDNGHEMIATLIREVARVLTAENVVLTGSSGGGYAALAVSFRVKGSIALPFSPQTSVEKYYQGHRTRLISAAFSGWSDLENGLTTNATRFDLGALYNSTD